MFCTFTLVISTVCVQCPIWLFFVVSWCRAYLVCFSGIFWMILMWFQLLLLLQVSLLFLHATCTVFLLCGLYILKSFWIIIIIIINFLCKCIILCMLQLSDSSVMSTFQISAMFLIVVDQTVFFTQYVTMCVIYSHTKFPLPCCSWWLSYFLAHKTHFFSRKMWPISTCVLYAKGKYYFQTYKYAYIYYTTYLSWHSENSHEDDFCGSDDDFLGFYDE